MLFFQRICPAAFLCLLSCSVASAETITFSGLTTDRATFTTYVQGNFTVTPESGTWLTNTSNYGDPVPSIIDEGTTASIDVTRNTGTLFTFSGVDLGNFDSVAEGYAITGYLFGSQIFTTTGALSTTSTAFVDYGTAYSSDVLSRLVITLGGSSEANVDNIAVSAYVPAATPEPESLTLVLTGAAGMAAVLRRRLAKK
jgi:hypothetical protein